MEAYVKPEIRDYGTLTELTEICAALGTGDAAFHITLPNRQHFARDLRVVELLRRVGPALAVGEGDGPFRTPRISGAFDGRVRQGSAARAHGGDPAGEVPTSLGLSGSDSQEL